MLIEQIASDEVALQFKMNEVIPITDRTFDFAARVVNLCKILDEKLL